MNKAILSIAAFFSVSCVTQLYAYTYTIINQRGRDLKNVEVKTTLRLPFTKVPKYKFDLKKGKSKKIKFGGAYSGACLAPIKINGKTDKKFKKAMIERVGIVCGSKTITLNTKPAGVSFK